MRRIAIASALLLGTVLFSNSVSAQHFDGNASNGTFAPAMTASVTQTLVNRPTGFSLNVTQADHEDPAVVMNLRSQEWQYAFATTRVAQDALGAPATKCSQTIDGYHDSPDGTGTGTNTDYSKRTDAKMTRAEKVGSIVIQAQADGISRPGAPIEWRGDIGFLSYDSVNQVGQMCILAISTDARLTHLPDPTLGDGKDDIEDETELILEFDISPHSDSSGTYRQVVGDLRGLVKDGTYQQLNVSAIQLAPTIFGHSVGNWQPGGIDFSKSPAVSGSKSTVGYFETCNASNVPAGGWGKCTSDKPSVTRIIPFTFTLPAPAIIGPVAGTLTNQNPVRITGTSDPNASVQLYESAAAISGATGTADAAGNWSVFASLADGRHSVIARVFDAGGSSPDSNSTVFTLDTTPPSPPSIVSPISGEIHDGTLVTFAGTTEPNADVEVAENGLVFATAHASPGGGWSVSTILIKGPHSVQARATDVAGNVGLFGPALSFSVTTATPVIQSPVQQAATNTTNLVIAGAAEPGATVSVSEGPTSIGSTLATPSGSWSLNAAFAEGDHRISALAVKDGFTSQASAPIDFTIDLTPPSAAVITSPAEGVQELSGQFDVVGTSEAAAVVSVYEGARLLGLATATPDGNWSVPVVLENGAHTIVAHIKDRAGNVGPNSSAVSFTIKDPLEIVTPRASSLNAGTVIVSGNADPRSTEVHVYEGSSEIGKVSAANGTWSIPLSFGSGFHSIFVRALTNGSLGNPSHPTAFRVDADPPHSIIFKPLGYTPLGGFIFDSKIRGSARDDLASDSGVVGISIAFKNLLTGAVVTVAPDHCYMCPGSYVQWNVKPRLIPGFYQVTTTAIDGVGNKGIDVVNLLIAF